MVVMAVVGNQIMVGPGNGGGKFKECFEQETMMAGVSMVGSGNSGGEEI